MLVAGGRLGDALGCRPVLVLGLSGFTLTSCAVGLAPNVELVIVARLIQGICIGVLVPQAAALIQQFFSGPERGKAFGFYGMAVASSAVVGPIFAGATIALAGGEHGWRWLFLVNVPVGLAAMVAVIRLVPPLPVHARVRPLRLDVVGVLLLGLAVLALLVPLITAPQVPASLGVLVAVPPLLLAFLRWEIRTVRRHRAPLLDVMLLRGLRTYGRGVIVGTLYFTGFAGFFLVVPVYLQDGRGLGPLAVGMLMTPFAVGSATAAVVTGRLVARYGRLVTVLALSTMMSGVGLIAVLVPERDAAMLWWLLPLTLLVTGIGAGGVTSPNFTITLSDVPPAMGGAAGAALQTGQRIGAAVGSALLMGVYGAALQAGADTGQALRASLLTALAVLLVAWLVTIREVLTNRKFAV